MIKALMVGCMMILTLFSSGCGSSEKISFFDLGQAGWAQAGIEVIDSQQQLEAIWEDLFGLLDKPRVNWEKEVLLGVFLGEKPTGGYSLKVNEVRLEDRELEIDVEVIQPEPGSFVIMIITYPGRLISLSRADLPSLNGMKVKAVDSYGSVIFETLIGDDL
jgi:hypothetical protein